MEGLMGLEPMTPCLKGRCSNQLSYRPTHDKSNYIKYNYKSQAFLSFLLLLLNKILINEKLTIDVTIHLLYRLKNPTTLVE